jgi:hypothetical protein
VGLGITGRFAVVTGATGTGGEDDPVSLSKLDNGTASGAGTGATGTDSLRGSFET